MKKKRRQFSRDFKIEAVRAMEDPDRSHLELAEDLDVSTALLYRWRNALKKEGQAAFPGSGNSSSQDDELARLRRENEQLKKERDFLKKAAAYFAKE
jgi:transposase